MKVFKFGGASVKDASSVKNTASVIKNYGSFNLLVVLSAMGKTTNAMEEVIKNYFEDKSLLQNSISKVVDFHINIISELFEDNCVDIEYKVGDLLNTLQNFLESNRSSNYSFVYDQVIGYGELISTTILSSYLNYVGVSNTWLDVRNFIKTDDYYRTANVDWDLTQKNVDKLDVSERVIVTQGFLGSDSKGFTTSLGREGSDYTAAIFANCLDAESVTIWKDVDGVLNADPRYFQNTQLLTDISYNEAIELAFYGASVIHPKTLQPLQRKNIPLFVKSFINPDKEGTKVGVGVGVKPPIPCLIVKKNQILLELSTKDFSYIVEKSISFIFQLLHTYKMKVDVIQNTAISLSVCFDDKYGNLELLLNEFKSKFRFNVFENLTLYTIRHYTKQSIHDLEEGKNILLKQLTKETTQIVVKD